MFTKLHFLALVLSAAAHPPPYGHHGGPPDRGPPGHGPPGYDPPAHGPPKYDDLTVPTTSGRVHGKIDSDFPDVRQFLGIPFAQPPVGDLRWLAPQPLSQPQAEIEAVDFGPSCMQFLNTNSSGVYLNEVNEYNLQGLNRTGDVSEDCLRLSVWTPSAEKCQGREDHGKGRARGHGRGKKDKGLPVLIFFYGGGFNTGGMNVPAQIPTQWVQRTQDHIVMSFNYRVNIFGHPNAPGLEDQNPGLLDQRAAVEWARDNIAAFGGDPDRITIWGQSAGSISVDYYSFTYPDDPIAVGMALDSGTVFSDITSADVAQSNFTFVAENVGCGDTASSPDALLECMRSVPASTIEDFLATYAESAQQPPLSFSPVIDDKVVFSNYTALMLAGKQAPIPAIIGTNAQDGVPFAPYSPSGPNETLATQALLATFFCPTTHTTALRLHENLSTYRYEYAGNWTDLSPEPWLGAFHSSELPMLFGTYDDFRPAGPAFELEVQTSVAMQEAWGAFARNGPEGLEKTGWSAYGMLGGDDVRIFGDKDAGVAVRDGSVAGLEGMCEGPAPASR